MAAILPLWLDLLEASQIALFGEAFHGCFALVRRERWFPIAVRVQLHARIMGSCAVERGSPNRLKDCRVNVTSHVIRHVFVVSHIRERAIHAAGTVVAQANPKLVVRVASTQRRGTTAPVLARMAVDIRNMVVNRPVNSAKRICGVNKSFSVVALRAPIIHQLTHGGVHFRQGVVVDEPQIKNIEKIFREVLARCGDVTTGPSVQA
mmetsp:Transcript_20917/g.39249  ORF Transcript_20917/g.39249 Transcript_20917/m.39249 type:complete len:206 (-) Transcript_20917:147-764(-)